MSITTKIPFFCTCGGVLLPQYVDKQKTLVCPICKRVSMLPVDTFPFKIKFEKR